MNKIRTLQDQFLHLQTCQANLYDAIKRRQKQLQADIQNRCNKYNCQIKREVSIKQKNVPQQIKHPANNPIYMYLGNCIQNFQLTNLDEIRERQQQRLLQMQRIKQSKSLEALRNQTQSFDNQMQTDERKRNRNQIKEQVPWKLMRKLRQQDVQQNKKRLDKQRADKLSKINKKYA